MSRDLSTMTWKEAEAALASGRAVIFPLGSTEQHGPHLPLSTDTVLAGEWARRIAAQIDALVLPTLPYGQVWSARAFPGTISLSSATLQALIEETARSLHRHGVRRLVLLSAHEGNRQVMRAAARALLAEVPELKVLSLCYPDAAQVVQGICDTPFWHGGTFHAAEVETSLMLAVAPEGCRMELAPREYPDVPPDFDTAPVPWDRFSRTGVFGDAGAATAEKGERLLEKWLAVMVERIRQGFEGSS
jgi:creatinine amidohydrolase